MLAVSTVRAQTAAVVERGEARRQGDSVCVSIGLDAARLDVMPTQVLTVTPRLVAGADSIVLPAIHVLGRQAYYRFVRHDSLGIVQPADRVLWQKRRYRPFAYAERAAWQPWMDHAELKVLVTCDDCCHWAFADSTAQRPHREMHVTDSRTSVRRAHMGTDPV